MKRLLLLFYMQYYNLVNMLIIILTIFILRISFAPYVYAANSSESDQTYLPFISSDPIFYTDDEGTPWERVYTSESKKSALPSVDGNDISSLFISSNTNFFLLGIYEQFKLAYLLERDNFKTETDYINYLRFWVSSTFRNPNDLASAIAELKNPSSPFNIYLNEIRNGEASSLELTTANIFYFTINAHNDALAFAGNGLIFYKTEYDETFYQLLQHPKQGPFVPDSNPRPEPDTASDTSSDTSLDAFGLNGLTPYEIYREFQDTFYNDLAEDVDVVTITRHFIETEISKGIFAKTQVELKSKDSLVHEFLKKTEMSLKELNVSESEMDIFYVFKTGIYSYNSCLLSDFDEGSPEFDLLYQQVYEATESLIR